MVESSWEAHQESAIGASGATRSRFRAHGLGIDAGLWQLYDVLQLTVQPEFNRKAVEIVIQPEARGISGEMLDSFGETAGTVGCDRRPVKRNPQVVAHGLHALMVLAVQPWQHGVSGEIFYPVLQGLRYVNAESRCLKENGGTGIRGKYVSPELRSRKFLADFSHEADSLPPLFVAFSGITKNDIEGRNDTSLNT